MSAKYFTTDKRVRWKRVSTALDVTLFFLVLVVGALVLFWMKAQHYDRTLIAFFPVGLLLLYAFLVTVVPRFRLREDHAGDNCYYLGFLFTLTSLSVALVSFAQAGGTEAIVEDFGIALGSTITGLALRVVLNQMRQDPVEVEREARLELAAAAQRLRASLDQSVLEMNAFSRTTRQSVAEGLEEMAAKVSEVVQKSLARYDRSATASAERIEKILEGFASAARNLESAVERNVAAAENMSSRIEAVRVPADLVEAKLEPITQSVGRLVESFSGVEALTARLDGLGRHIETAERALATLGSSLSRVSEALSAGAEARRSGLEKEAETARAATETMTRSLDAFRGAWEAVQDTLDRTSSLIGSTAHQSSLLADIEKHLDAAGRKLQSQVAAFEEIEKHLRTMPKAIEESVSRIAGARRRRMFAWLPGIRR